MGMIMDENNFRVQDEEIINCKCNCNIARRMVKGAKQLQNQLELNANDN